MNEPENVPTKNMDPMRLISNFSVQYRSILLVQFVRVSIASGSGLKS